MKLRIDIGDQAVPGFIHVPVGIGAAVSAASGIPGHIELYRFRRQAVFIGTDGCNAGGPKRPALLRSAVKGIGNLIGGVDLAENGIRLSPAVKVIICLLYTSWCVLWRIIVPVSKPGIATVLLFCIVGHWNSWFDGIIYMNKMIHYPLQSYLQKMIMDMETMMRASGGDYVLLLSMMNARTGRAAQLFLGALPMLIVYPFLQKYFTKGLVLGSVKG